MTANNKKPGRHDENSGDNSRCAVAEGSLRPEDGNSSSDPEYGVFKDDDKSIFTVRTVLENQAFTKFRSIPASISSECVESSSNRSGLSKDRPQNGLIAEESFRTGEDVMERLRFTSSLMDDSFDSSGDFDHEDPIQSQNFHRLLTPKTIKKSNCNRDFRNFSPGDGSTGQIPFAQKTSNDERNPCSRNGAKASRQGPYDEIDVNSGTFSTSLLDLEIGSEDEMETYQQKEDNVLRRSNKFLLVYDEISAQSISSKASFGSQNCNHMKGNNRRNSLKNIVSTAVQSLTGGIISHAGVNARYDEAGSSEGDTHQNLSGKKRRLEELGDMDDDKESTIRKQLLAKKEEECRNLNQKLSNCETQIKYLKHENSTAFQSITLLTDDVTLARDEAKALREEKMNIEAERDSLQNKVHDFQKESNSMKQAMLALANADHHRVENINDLEAKLTLTRSCLAEATLSASEAKKTAKTLRIEIEKLRAENLSLTNDSGKRPKDTDGKFEHCNDKLMTAKKEAERWRIKVEEDAIEIRMLQMELASALKSSHKPPAPTASWTRTPIVENLGLIHAFGAEDLTDGSELFHQRTCVSKLPLPTVLPSPTENSSRRLLYAASGPLERDEKSRLPGEDNRCCLCFRDSSGAMKSCQCGKNDCEKRAHATCLAKYRVGDVSNCVSHPGTPLPPMPLILCNGIWKN